MEPKNEFTVSIPEYDLVVINKFINSTQVFHDRLNNVRPNMETYPQYNISDTEFMISFNDKSVLTASHLLLGTYLIIEHPDPEDETVVKDESEEFIWQWTSEKQLPEHVLKLCDYVEPVYKSLCMNPVISSRDNMLFVTLLGLCIECFDFQYVWTVPISENLFKVYGLTNTNWI